LTKRLPKSLLNCLASSLDEDPLNRTSFQEMFEILAGDNSDYGNNDELNGATMWIQDW
jgi:hypothetical protein